MSGMEQPARPPDPDLELFRRVQAGDGDAFRELVRRHEHAIYRTSLAITRNEADAEDVTQETFLRAFAHRDQFRGEARFATWLTQIAINSARMRLRKRHGDLWESLDQATEDSDHAPREIAEWREDPEIQYGKEELRARVEQALGGLPPAYRAVLVLRDLRDCSTQETAEILGLSLANVKTRLLRARLMLRERLAKRAGISMA